jgi:hypothetical protein
VELPHWLSGGSALFRILGCKRIHNRRPTSINSFKDESGVIDGVVHVELLPHVWFVRVHVDEFARGQNRCGNPRAYSELAPYGKTIGILFLLLGITLAVAGVGWLNRRI